MYTGLSFKELEVVQIVVTSARDILVYTKFPQFFNLSKFLIWPNGRVFGESAGSWLELTFEAASQIKRLVKERPSVIPIYFVGPHQAAA